MEAEIPDIWGILKNPPNADFDTWIPDMSGKIRTYGNPKVEVRVTTKELKKCLHYPTLQEEGLYK